MAFLDDDFLLHTPTARRLYHEFAEGQPILDYHSHLPPREIAENRTFDNLHDIWLAGDHYKWRAMRANGVGERYCTGDTEPREKFLAWARTVPYTLRNPLYHWTHLELRRYFGITELLDEHSGPRIWDQTREMLRTPGLSVHGILKRFNVRALCTTDDPADDLAHHRQIAVSGLETKVYPAFRPDKALAVDQPAAFNAWVDRLGAVANVSIERLPDLLDALERRHREFHDAGCRLSDHGLPHAYADFPDDQTAATIFDQARAGRAADAGEHARFASYMMLHFGRMDALRGWTKQLHLGPLRNANTRALQVSGPDTGYDSIGDHLQAAPLAAYLDRLEREDSLPKMIVYNVNPADNYVFSTLIGSFQDGSIPGKMQYGAGWWYLDAKGGIEWQLNALSNNGLLSRFIGMLTDSRSFLSFPRHEYFRRVLCNLVGGEVEQGELPDYDGLVGGMVAGICYGNAAGYLGLVGV